MELSAIRNQTLVVQTTYQPTPHLETEMEVVMQLLAQENTVYWLICRGHFQVCFHNPTHKKSECYTCHSRVCKGVDWVAQKSPFAKRLHRIGYTDFETPAAKAADAWAAEVLKSSLGNKVTDLKGVYYREMDAGLAVASSLISELRNHEPNLSQYPQYIRRGLATCAYVYETALEMLQQLKPDLVLLFNGRFVENRPFLRAAQQLQLPYVTHERAGKLHKYLLRYNTIPHDIDTATNEIEQLWQSASDDRYAIGAQFFTNRRQQVEEAWYSFVKNQTIGKVPESMLTQDGIRKVVIFNSSLDEYEGLSGFGPFFYANDNEGIKQICQSLMPHPQWRVYLRIHPNLKGLDNAQNAFIDAHIRPMPNVEIIEAAADVDSYAVMDQADVVLTFGSTIGIEAAYAQKRVILLGRAFYERLEGIEKPTSHQALIDLITQEHPFVPNQEGALKYGYWSESYGTDYQYYEAQHIAQGRFMGTTIKPNRWINEYRRNIQKIRGTYKKRNLS